VSDGALSQAVRTLRRALGDDPREPRYIRTVSRHGYQFVFPGVAVEPDVPTAPAGRAAPRLEEQRDRASLPLGRAAGAAGGGALAGLGVGWGLALGEARARALRPFVLMVCAAAGGGAIGIVAHTIGPHGCARRSSPGSRPRPAAC
jgi:hypothetical protein